MQWRMLPTDFENIGAVLRGRYGKLIARLSAAKEEALSTQNWRCAMIVGLDRWFASQAEVGPEHKKEHRMLLGISLELILFTTQY